jgi:hypothetical protein
MDTYQLPPQRCRTARWLEPSRWSCSTYLDLSTETAGEVEFLHMASWWNHPSSGTPNSSKSLDQQPYGDDWESPNDSRTPQKKWENHPQVEVLMEKYIYKLVFNPL